MRSYRVVAGQDGFPSQFDTLRADARGGSFLLPHQQLGTIALPTAPTNAQTLTLTINGSAIVLAAVGTIGTTSGNILNPGTAAGFAANVLALLNQPQTTTANGVALSAADQQFLSYLSFSLVGTTITVSSSNNSLYAPLTSFSASTTVTGASWTGQTMQLYVEPGVLYVAGTRVIFSGGSTPTVTAPSTHPRIDVLTIDSTGTLAWTTGTESATPSAPTYPVNKVPLCEIYNVVGETALYDNDNQQSAQGYISNDVRAFVQPSMNWTAFTSDLIPDADGTRNLGSSGFEWNNIYAKSGIFLNGAAFGTQLTFASTALESINARAPVAIGLSQSQDIGIDTTGETTATGSVTIGVNSNRALLVIAFGIGSAGGSPVISGTFAGQTLSFTSTHYLDSVSNSYSIGTAVLAAPPTGSGSFNLLSSGGSVSGVFYLSVYNAAQTSPQDATGANFFTTATTTPSVSANIGTDGALTFGAFFFAGNGGFGTPAGNVYNSNTATSSPNPTYAYGNSGVSNIYPANATMTLSTTGATSQNWYTGLVSVKPFNAVTEGLLNASSSSISLPNTRCTGFTGFAVTSQTSGQALTAVVNGIIIGLSGLTLGQEYYLNDINGTIGTSPGTNSRKVGVAVSATELLITNIW